MQITPNLRSVAWPMEPDEEDRLLNLSEIVELWHVYDRAEEDDGTYYLSERAAMKGLHAYALSCPCSAIIHVATQRARIIALDSDRDAAQVVFDA